MPVLWAAAPLWPLPHSLHDWMHPLLALLLVPVTGIAMWNAARWRRPKRIQVLLGTGLTLVLLALPLHAFLGNLGEVVLTLVGSALLIAGHLFNWRAAHRHQHAR